MVWFYSHFSNNQSQFFYDFNISMHSFLLINLLMAHITFTENLIRNGLNKLHWTDKKEFLIWLKNTWYTQLYLCSPDLIFSCRHLACENTYYCNLLQRSVFALGSMEHGGMLVRTSDCQLNDFQIPIFLLPFQNVGSFVHSTMQPITQLYKWPGYIQCWISEQMIFAQQKSSWNKQVCQCARH